MIDIDTPKSTSKENNEKYGLMTLPTAPSTDMMMTILGYRGDFSTMQERRNAINHASVITTEMDQTGEKRRISLSSDREQVEIQIPDIQKFFGKGVKSKTASRKLLTLILIEANKTAIKDGELVNRDIEFPLKKIVELGIYSTIASARQGFYENMEPLQEMKVKGVKLKNGKETGRGSVRPLFSGVDVEDAFCRVILNDKLNWSALIQFYTYIPEYYFVLSSRAEALLYTIFYLARQRGKELKDKGRFIIKYRTLQYRMNLPDEKKVKNARRNIIKVIEEAAKEIEEFHRKTYGENSLQIIPMGYTDKERVARCLDEGYLEIRLQGDFLDPFVKIGLLKAKRIAQNEKRKEKIIDAAKAKNLAKRMEEEDQ